MIALAYAALFLWPLVAWRLFKARPLPQAVIATVLWGYLLLPETIGPDLPLIPPLDKTLIPALSAALLAWAFARRQAGFGNRRNGPADHPRAAAYDTTRTEPAPAERTDPAAEGADGKTGKGARRIVQALTLLLLLAPIPIYITNTEALRHGPRLLPGLGPHDVASMMLSVAITLLPLYLARRWLGTAQARVALLRAMAGAGLVYSALMLVELRLSPQLNQWLYGFFAHSFAQHIRDGFRPIVFLGHGLRVGIFMAMAVLAAATLARASTTPRARLRWLVATAWLMLILGLSHNLGATLIALVLLPLVLVAPRRLQAVAALCIALLVLGYPVIRGSGLAPAARIAQAIAPYAPDRAQSLEYRLSNEDQLIARANEKPLAGWGGWGRNLIYDDVTGEQLSVVDGTWVIMIGSEGWLGYLSYFGLLCLPVLIAALRARRLELDVIDMGLVLMLCANLVDILPNSSAVPVLWLVCGTLWARLEKGGAHAPQEAPLPEAPASPRMPYSRDAYRA